jgi:hypothetical protein
LSFIMRIIFNHKCSWANGEMDTALPSGGKDSGFKSPPARSFFLNFFVSLSSVESFEIILSTSQFSLHDLHNCYESRQEIVSAWRLHSSICCVLIVLWGVNSVQYRTFVHSNAHSNQAIPRGMRR